MGADARVDVLLALKAKLEGFDGAAKAVPGLERSVQNAGREIKQQTRSISADVDAMGVKLKQAFAPANLARGFLAGAGIGSGVALVGFTINKWAEVWKESAEHAADLQTRAENIATAMQATARAAREAFIGTLDPAAQRTARLKEAADLEARMQAAEARRAKSLEGIGWAQNKIGNNPFGMSNFGGRVMEFGGEKFGTSTGMGARTFVELMQERADAAQVEFDQLHGNLIKTRSEIAKLDKEIAKLDKDTAESAKKTDDTAKKVAAEKHQEALKKEEAARKHITAAIARQDEEMERLRDKYLSIADPSRQFTEQMEEVNFLLRGGKISAEEAADAIDALTRAMKEAEASRVDKALTDFFGGLDEQSAESLKAIGREGKALGQELAQMWNSVSDRAGQAFADILLEGKNSFRALGQEISRSILEITARMAIINPILNAVFGNIGGYQKLPTFSTAKAAGGGSFLTSGPTNFTVGDNPGGVELVSVLPLSGVGRSSINGRSLAMAGGGSALVGGMGGGDTFNFAYTFAGGVSREEVLGLIPTIVDASKSAVLDAKRRGRDGFRR